MKVLRAPQSGFTLIEALIAFVIIAVGLLGAAMFQSELVRESGDSKARAVALKLAENELEEQRNIVLLNGYASMAAQALLDYPASLAVGNTTYTLDLDVTTLTPASAAATSFEDHYELSSIISWQDPRGNAASVSLSSRFVWNDPDESLDNNDQAGVGGGANIGDIERPSGAAIAIARVTTDVAHDASKEVGDWVSLGDDKYGIKVTDAECTDGGNTCDQVVSVIELVDTTSPIFKITGNIYFHDGPDNDFDDVAAAPNVLTSEGGGCAVYQVGTQAAYTCLFGKGWYGTITLILALENSGKPADSVCLSPREYKYYLVNPASVAGTNYAAAIIGQSGLVRFTTDAGSGPYLASSTANPGFGYYYTYSEIDKNTVQVPGPTNTAGNLENQHFVITDDTPTGSGSLYSVCDQATGGKGDEPLFSSALHNLSGYPDQSNDNFGYLNVASGGEEVEIPHEEIILGYVNKTYEINGFLDVSGASDDATTLKPDISVGLTPLPDNAQECVLEEESTQSIQYRCFVDYNWTGTISISMASGAASSLDFAPDTIVFDDPAGVGEYPPISGDVDIPFDIIVTDTP
ncbi:type IV pilus modification PilV family protein [Neptuniibacter halophilus]|uniref:type IV pilus modification PilV family protein n=1 Tax=Neptuniibacter halophilus TaxID=651666 RepID=UPI0025741D72|nr:prepilin-type N-terminal cleavage/methylation domain-containing protein [Neptuniibacter halophilus]